MKLQPSYCVLTAVAAAGALLLGCEGGIQQLDPQTTASESELIAAYVDPISPIPGGSTPRLGGDGDKLPLLDGTAQDKEWNVAQPLYVYVTGANAMGGAGYYIELRAVWSDEGRFIGNQNHLFLMVRYAADGTFDNGNIFPDYWLYARQGGVRPVPSPQTPLPPNCTDVIMRGENWMQWNAPAIEDEMSLIWEIDKASDALGTFDQIGCQVACHSGGGKDFGAVPNGKLDVWVWRAGRTNAQKSTVYPADISRVNEETGRPESLYPRIDLSTEWPAYMEDMNADASGMHPDATLGDAWPFHKGGYTGQLYTPNLRTSPVDGRPIPTFITDKQAKEDRGGTSGTAAPVVPANGGLPATLYLWGPSAVQLTECTVEASSRISTPYKAWSVGLPLPSKELDQKFPPDFLDVMPGYVLWIPNGSAADVRAQGALTTSTTKRFTTWTIEVRRSFSTGNADDVVFDENRDFTFTVAVFDRSSRIHSGSGPLKLRFQPSIHASKPQPAGGTSR